ncbi:hypothetical protein DL95DRAFT_502637 [Leptodontidium sp. 2 PMI_412]|nr:hypothetical protein DL95DRAFT_502637 [Leptodontidium sp. 2 PMI_412]
MESTARPTHRDESVDEYSDVASVHSEDQTRQRRKHNRGGRKVSPVERTPEETAGLLGPENSPDNESHSQDEDGEVTCRYCSRKPQKANLQERRTVPEPFETGIRAFNIRKAAGSRRPVGVRATSDKKKPATAKPATRRSATSKNEDAGYETQSREDSSKSESEEEEESEEQEEKVGEKPMSIRLDLDLMIEVFLKAKIKGAVTITFLE